MRQAAGYLKKKKGLKYQVPYIPCQCFCDKHRALVYIDVSPAPCIRVAGMPEVLLAMPLAVGGLRIFPPGTIISSGAGSGCWLNLTAVAQ